MKKLFLLCFSVFPLLLFANIRLPKIFGDSMVLQRDQPIPVWGWAVNGETVTVQFHNQTKKAKAGKDGKWMVRLDNESAGGPYHLRVSGKDAVTLNDILVGDVWICSGQSNMEFQVSSVNNAAQEIAAANYPLLRHFKVQNSVSGTPLPELQYGGSWKAATPQNVGSFTAVGYFFGRELTQDLQVPIGLLNTTWGGTDVETWTSREAFEKSDEFKTMIGNVGVINLDSAAKVRTQQALGTITKLQGALPAADAVAHFSEADYDAAAWPQMTLPTLWENAGLPDFDGVVWFRKTIELGDAADGKGGELQLSMIDDNDDTYINGVKVGSTAGWNIMRVYTIPAGTLKKGKNIIAVRVQDTGGGGGLYGAATDMKITAGGTTQALAGPWQFQVAAQAASTGSVNPNSYPTLLYNAMVAPLIPFAIKGAIWYQGENNAGRAYQYRQAFPLMITDWRQRWGRDFPFYFVQLASFNAANGNSQNGSSWAELREAQAQTLQLPNTGMAVTTDVGNPLDIHPRNKQDVGLRLAAIALHNDYGKENLYSGPVYKTMQADGNKVRLQFTQTGGGLMAKDKYGYVKGFEIAGEDQHFHYAKAVIDGEAVMVSADSVNVPVAVRYNWADDASDGNLFNKEGFPAAPFRSDSWKSSTEAAKYRE